MFSQRPDQKYEDNRLQQEKGYAEMEKDRERKMCVGDKPRLPENGWPLGAVCTRGQGRI